MMMLLLLSPLYILVYVQFIFSKYFPEDSVYLSIQVCPVGLINVYLPNKLLFCQYTIIILVILNSLITPYYVPFMICVSIYSFPFFSVVVKHRSTETASVGIIS